MNKPRNTKPDIEAELRSISKTYVMGGQAVHALSQVDLSFYQGDFWAILGASGSGKSTLLNLLGCLDRPTAGNYILSGAAVQDMTDDELSEIRLRKIGFIFQSFNLIQQLTVEENIQLPLYYQEMDEEQSREKAKSLAESVGLGDRIQHIPSELSGGQQQRVAVARSLANDPQIILADEPTGNLDSSTSKEIMSLLCSLNEQGKTIIMVTHEQDIASYTKQQLYMKDGKVERTEGALE